MDWNQVPAPVKLSEEDVIRQLFHAGWLGPDWDAVRRLGFDSPQTKEAVIGYREFNGIVGGETELVDMLLRPRCGLPDQLARADAGLCRWPHLDVTASQQLAGLNPLAADVERQVYIEALTIWNAASGLRLRLIDTLGSANIYSEVGSTGAGVLAYSYLPCGASQTSRMQQVYSRSTVWTRNLLLQVVTHEIGHALGLDHGPSGALMQPTADGRITKLSDWDINQIRQRYGDPVAGKNPSPVPEAPKPPTTPTTPTNGPTLILPANLVAGRYRLVAETAGADDWGQ